MNLYFPTKVVLNIFPSAILLSLLLLLSSIVHAQSSNTAYAKSLTENVWTSPIYAQVSQPFARLPRYAADPYACDAGHFGYLYANTTSNTQRFCNGTSWQTTATGSTSPGGSSGQLQKNSSGAFAGSLLSDDGTNVTQSSGTFFAPMIGVNLGGVTPPTAFTVGDTSSSTPRGLMSWQASNDTASAHLHMRKSRGTFATPTTIVSGDVLGRVVFGGYDGSAYNESGYIRATSTGTIAGTRVPSKLEFFTSTDASPSVATLALTLNADQSATFANTVNATTFVGAVTGTASGNLTASNTATLTNKTFDTAGAGNSFSINGVAASTNTGTGAVVRATSPTLVTPVLGAATATSINGNAFTTGTYTLTGAAGKTFTFNNSLTLSGTDATTMTFPTTSATIARTDAANTFAGLNIFSTNLQVNGRVMLNGSTSSFPAIRNTGTTLDVVLADASQYTKINALAFQVAGGTILGGCAGSCGGGTDGVLVADNGTNTAGIRFQFTTASTISSGFGTSPTITTGSTDTAGEVNVGTGGSATSGVIGFASTWTSAPFCIAQDSTTAILQRAVSTTTTLTITSASAWTASDKIEWHCIGSK